MSDMRIDAPALRQAFGIAESWLATNRDGINAINVYPVPDGDTGTNMLLTIRYAFKELPDNPSHIGEMTAQVSRAALLGARGNSGVITSQMLRGFAESLASHEHIDCHTLVHALTGAAQTAYSAVSQPVEGTMLTVMREAAEAGEAAITAGSDDAAILRAVIDEGYASVQRTPTLLPRLAEAGVVDSGGAGVAVLLEGIALSLTGQQPPEQPRYAGGEQIVLTDAVEHEGHGYCTEFIAIAGPDAPVIDRPSMEASLISLGGESVLVVGDDRTVHVHVHMEDPGPAISLGAQAGALLSVKVENMQAQHEDWMAGHDADDNDAAPTPTAPAKIPEIGLVAVARGAGIASAFRDLGATGIVDAGDGTKASAGELLEACKSAGTSHVFVLPNDKDVLMAAETCAREADGFVTVIPTRNAAAGLAAAVYYLPSGDPESIASDMNDALEGVRCVEVSRSVRTASVDGVQVTEGDAIAFLDGKLIHATSDTDEALIAALAQAIGEDAEIVTIYLGADAAPDAEERLRPRIEQAHPGIELDIMPGGQPHYPYLASIE